MSEPGLMDGRLDAWKAVVAKQAARVAELEKALTKIANCGQSQEPDHWKFRVMARDTARTTLEASERGGGE